MNDSTLNCGGFGWFGEVRFNIVMGDGDGHSINPGPETLGCQTDGTGLRRVAVTSTQRLHKCANGHGPYWEAEAKVVRNGDSDLDRTLGGTMWGFVGPFPVNCRIAA